MIPQKCPLCDKECTDLYNPVSDPVYICKCKKSVFIDKRGWFVSFPLIRDLSDKFLTSMPEQRAEIMKFLGEEIPQSMLTVESSLDSSTVRLYCSNPNCNEKGYITRTRKLADKSGFTCHVCDHPMKYQ